MNIQLVVLLGLLVLTVVVVIVVLRRIEREGTTDTKEVKEGEKEKKEEPPKGPSLLAGLGGNVSNALSKLVWFAIIIAFIFLVVFLIGIVSYKAMDTLDTFFSSMTDTSVPEKDEWRYCQKRDSSDKFECEYDGNAYKVKGLRHIPGEKIHFEVYWNLGHGVFNGDIGSSETGTYRNFMTGEEGRFEGLEWTGIGFTTGRMICQKNCKSKGYLFTLDKKK